MGRISRESDAVVCSIPEIAIRPAMPDIRQQFVAYLNDFSAVEDQETFLADVAMCYDILPNDVCDTLGLEYGSSFADAAELLEREWATSYDEEF